MRCKNALHPMKVGDPVAVFALNPFGEPYLEGWAFIRANCIQPHHYRIRFYGERVVRTRFVNPDWQQEPRRSYALLRDFWRASNESYLDEFFPDENASEQEGAMS
jgi:hypothetical protein